MEKDCDNINFTNSRPKIGKSKSAGPDTIRRHNKGCNCKRSGCLKNYCECYEVSELLTPSSYKTRKSDSGCVQTSNPPK